MSHDYILVESPLNNASFTIKVHSTMGMDKQGAEVAALRI